MSLAYAPDEGDDMARRRRSRNKANSVPTVPVRVLVKLGNREIVSIAFGDDPGLIVPGSIVWHCDPAGISGPDRERAVAYVVKEAKLDPKEDFERLYAALWSQAPKRE
jgi:hypothetical protein